MYCCIEFSDIFSCIVILVQVRLLSCDSRKVLCILGGKLVSMVLILLRVFSISSCVLGEGRCLGGICVSIFRKVVFSVQWWKWLIIRLCVMVVSRVCILLMMKLWCEIIICMKVFCVRLVVSLVLFVWWCSQFSSYW